MIQFLSPGLAAAMVVLGIINPDVVTVAMGAGLLAYVWFTRHAKYEVYQDRLIIYYGAPRIRSVSLADIAEVRLVKAPLGGQDLLVVRKGRGVMVIRPRDAEGFAAALEGARGVPLTSRVEPITPDGREEVMAYYEKSVRITALQTREADQYNSALLIHMNSLDDSESAKTMIDASKRLALCGKECIRRHASLSPVPDPAAADYAAWGLLYNDYSAWADAQHDAFVALSQGRTPVATRVRELMDTSERQRKVAEREGRNLLQAVGLKGQDLQRFMAAGQDATAPADTTKRKRSRSRARRSRNRKQ